jgi:hypothetical protein
MQETSIIFLAIAAIAGIREAPRIIWAFRCPSESAHYVCPQTPHLVTSLRVLFSVKSGDPGH